MELLNIDCMEYMAGLSDNSFNFAVVDPPYGITDWNKRGSNANRAKGICPYKTKKWDIRPEQVYFDELLRVSKSQIIWGANHFFGNLPPTKAMIVWDKRQDGMHFNHCEIAWCNNLNESIRIFRKASWLEKNRFHPTQKPVALYNWIYQNYAKPGQRILDTHLGSGSSAIAAHYFGAEFVGCEIDKEYYDAAVLRINQETRQEMLPGF